jgi:hypothetical protein
MAYPIGSVVVTGTIGTTSSIDTYSTHQDYLGFGGLRAVGEEADRDAIPTARRTFGMVVVLQNAGGSFVLANVAMGGSSNTLSDNTNLISYAKILNLNIDEIWCMVWLTFTSFDIFSTDFIIFM